MRRIAIASLLFDRGKLLAALAGVAFSTTLALVQIGAYLGFVRASSELVTRAGGDLWVMAKGTAVLDNAPPLPESTRTRVSEHPCVTGVRAVGVAFVRMRGKDGGEDGAFVVGFEPRADRLLPWSLARGLPGDLHGPMRVSVDVADLSKLRVTGEALGARLEMAGHEVIVSALTSKVRSFTLSPYVFTEMPTLRALARMDRGDASYWVADLASPACAADAARWVERHPALAAHSTAEFRAMSEDYWVWGSGAGTIIAFGAGLGLFVGSVIVAQTLFSLTRQYTRELATLKALGSGSRELLAFVGWQAGFLAATGGAVGTALAFGVRALADGVGLVVELGPSSLAVGLSAVGAMCAAASVASVRAVLLLDPAEVFK